MQRQVQGKTQKNLPGKAKKPQSPNFGMTKVPKKGSAAKKMKKGGCV